MKRRVVITGQGCISPYGRGLLKLIEGVRENRSAIRFDPRLSKVKGLQSHLSASVVEELDVSPIPRKHRRLMSRMSVFATLATLDALRDAELAADAFCNMRSGNFVGSTIGSGAVLEEIFSDYIPDQSLEQLKSASFFKTMNHGCAASIAISLGISARIMSLSCACATSMQNVGLAYELIASNRLDRAIAGGADELHPLTSSIFDVLKAATTTYNHNAECAPRPFDKDRDGIVCGEGAGILILESLESARQRNAHILGEIAGFATVTDVASLAQPNPQAMKNCILSCIEDAGIAPSEIGYVNAHATGTLQGDAAEAIAIGEVIGDTVPVSSFKGHFGHTLAACGSLEVSLCLDILEKKPLISTRNLEKVADDCTGVLHATSQMGMNEIYILKNNFAFGGVNSSLLLKQYIP